MLHPSQVTKTDLGDRNWWRWKSTSLSWFNANVMPWGWDDKFHDFGMIQREMCDHLDPAVNRNPQIYLSAFRGSHKTTQLHGLICFFLSWNLAKKNSNSLVYNTATKDNAFNMSADVKHSLLQNDVLQWVFPELPKEENAYDDMTQKRIQHRQVKLDFASLETTMVSRHYPVWLNDDLENDENAKTEYMREELKKKWKYQKAVLTKIKSRGIGLEYEIGTPYSVNGLTWMIRNLARYSKLEIPCYVNKDIKQGVTFPELYAVEDFEAKREEMGASIFCTPAETPILMGDWTTRPISEVKVDDEVVGFTVGGDRKGKYVRSVVKSIYKGQGKVLDVQMASGTIVRCTPEHKWFSGRLEELKKKKTSHHKLYKKIRRNTNLIRLLDVAEEKDPKKLAAWSWLGGIVDGEGGCKGSGIFIHQSPEANPEVYEKIRETLDFLGIKYSEINRPRIDGHKAPDGHLIVTSSANCFYLKGGRQLYFDLIRYSGLAKKGQLVEKMWRHNGFANTKDKTGELRPEKTRAVYGLETETGNYVAWGCLSSNSAQYLLKPLSEEDALCPEGWLRKWNKLPDLRWRSMVVDPGGSSPGKSDATGITIIDTDENGILYIVYADEHFLTPEKLIDCIVNLKNIYDPDDVRIEKEKYSTTIADTWQHKYPLLNISFVEHKGRRKGWSKGTSANMNDSRIWRLKQWFETRRILVGPNMPVFEKQLLEYPDSTRDDMLDSLAYQLDIRRLPKRKGKIVLPSGREFEPSIEESFEKEMDIFYERKRERAEERNQDAAF